MHKLVAITCLVLAIGALTTACDNDEFPLAPHVPREDLLAAPDTLTIAGYGLQVDPFLYRDFFPVAPPDGRPLAGGCRLHVPAVLPFPSIPMQEAFVWVVNGESIWSAKASITVFYAYADIVASGGPKWGPGITVDLVVGVRDGGGALHLVLFRDVLIQRTDR